MDIKKHNKVGAKITYNNVFPSGLKVIKINHNQIIELGEEYKTICIPFSLCLLQIEFQLLEGDKESEVTVTIKDKTDILMYIEKHKMVKIREILIWKGFFKQMYNLGKQCM